LKTEFSKIAEKKKQTPHLFHRDMCKKSRGKKRSRKKEKMKIKQRKKRRERKLGKKQTLIFQGFVANTLHIKNKLLLLNQVEFQKSFSHSENIVPKKN